MDELQDVEQRLRDFAPVSPKAHLDRRIEQLLTAAPRGRARLYARPVPLWLAAAVALLCTFLGGVFRGTRQEAPSNPAYPVHVIQVLRQDDVQALRPFDWSQGPGRNVFLESGLDFTTTVPQANLGAGAGI